MLAFTITATFSPSWHISSRFNASERSTFVNVEILIIMFISYRKTTGLPILNVNINIKKIEIMPYSMYRNYDYLLIYLISWLINNFKV